MAEENLHFAKAPIVEAVIAFEIEMLPEEMLPALEGFGRLIGESYTFNKRMAAGTFRFGPQTSEASATSAPLGFIFKSNDERYAVQARRNGFAFSRLAPYDSWEPFRDEAKRLWGLYRSILPAISIHTLSTRYINRLLIPGGEPIDRYLRIYPYLPENFPQEGPNAFLRVELMIKEPQGALVVQLQVSPAGVDDRAACVLDNDLRFSGVGLNEPEMWKRLERARELKNQYFLAQITDKTQELIS